MHREHGIDLRACTDYQDLDDTINLPQENPQQVVVSMPVPSESYKESMMDLSALRGRPSMTYTFGTFHRRIEDGAVSLNNQDIEEVS